MFTGELTEVGSITSDMMPSSRDGEVPQVLAISDDGTFYVINASTRNTYLYSFRLTEDGKIGELTNVGKTGFKANYLQSMAFDHSNRRALLGTVRASLQLGTSDLQAREA